MATHALTENFRSFFGKLNPSIATEQTAASEYAAVKSLIEDPNGAAAVLSPTCFLQGSYRQQTAIHTLHDIDIVALCDLMQPGGASSSGSGQGWNRHRIFDTVSEPLANSPRFRGKVHYTQRSMCIKIDSAMRLEILPVVYKAGTTDSAVEPFRLYRPETQTWEDGFARYHQQWLSWKNNADKTSGNLIPAIKVFKHLRSHHNMQVVSFHLECLLFALPDTTFTGAPPDYIARILNAIAGHPADTWYGTVIRTPCKDRDIFTGSEWPLYSWRAFHQSISELAPYASLAVNSGDRAIAIGLWQFVLGDTFFPHL
jgi:hypothetical protein